MTFIREKLKMFQVMRNLHPRVSVAGDCEMLDTALRQWRRKCEEAMGFTVSVDHFRTFYKNRLIPRNKKLS